METALINLTELEPGRQAVIRKLAGGRFVISRLTALGFTPGAPVTVIRNDRHGPLLVFLRNSRVALGHGEAGYIRVSPGIVDEPETSQEARTDVTIALAGQPNVGKSSVFNGLTGMNQHVGNWTGKTVECKTGTFSFKGTQFSLVDLPGTYSLTAGSEEEVLAREFIIKEQPDMIVAVVNAATLERSLYLVAELLNLPVPLIVALNMVDVAEQEGVKIEPKVLEAALGIPVVPMVAARGAGLAELQEVIVRVARREYTYMPRLPLILPAHRAILEQLQHMIHAHVPSGYPADWVALKLLEGDEQLTGMMQSLMPAADWEQVHGLLYQHEDAILDIAGARYEWVARIIRAAVVEPGVTRVGLTARLDRVLTHPVWGALVLVAILGLVFFLTYQVGGPAQTWLSAQLTNLSDAIRTGWTSAPRWLPEFISGGVLGGIGMVLTFLPILVIFFAVLGFLEDTGYMARAAYLSDRWMHMMGLHGKSFMPIMLGFGCNVPAVLGTRIIESKKARLLTTLLIPLVPCTARMAVIAVLASLFFGQYAIWVTWGLVGLNVLILAGLGILLHHFLFENEHVPFIMELPLYHLPNLKTIGIYVYENILGFLKKAGTTILIATLIVWALSYFPTGDVMSSYLSMAGRAIEPAGKLLGLPWPVLVALLTSFVAKENTIATLGVLYGSLDPLTTVMLPSAGLAFLAFQMLFIPCVGTVAAIKQETKSWKWTAASVGMQLVLSFSVALVIFQVGRLI